MRGVAWAGGRRVAGFAVVCSGWQAVGVAITCPLPPFPRSLCRDGTNGPDYHFNDNQGHDYFANVCGIAAAKCLPTWLATYALVSEIPWDGSIRGREVDASSLLCTVHAHNC